MPLLPPEEEEATVVGVVTGTGAASKTPSVSATSCAEIMSSATPSWDSSKPNSRASTARGSAEADMEAEPGAEVGAEAEEGHTLLAVEGVAVDGVPRRSLGRERRGNGIR